MQILMRMRLYAHRFVSWRVVVLLLMSERSITQTRDSLLKILAFWSDMIFGKLQIMSQETQKLNIQISLIQKAEENIRRAKTLACL